jgi:segregation and condensation protein A
MNDEGAQLTSGTQFAVSTQVYSGPLDLLIDLIERRKLLVNDISLAQVTDDYLRYVAAHEESPLHDMADFIVLAATLLLIKSRSLLPVLPLTESEEESIEDLEQRLRLYSIYRSAGQSLSARFDRQPAYERPYRPWQRVVFMPDASVSTDRLAAAMFDIIAHLPKKTPKPAVRVKTVVSLEEMMNTLARRIEKQFRLTFHDFTGGSAERGTVIVGFLAVLEMVKQGTILVQQSARCADIQIESERPQTPRYHG